MAQADAVAIEAVPGTARPSGARIGYAFVAVTCLWSALAVALDLHAGSYDTLVYVGLAVVLGATGVVLTTRMPRHRISWVMAVGALWWALGSLSYAYAVEALVTRPDTLPGGVAAAWLDSFAWLPGLALLGSLLLVLMPDGRLTSRRWWPVPAAVAAGCVLAALETSTSSTFDLGDATVANPWSTGSFAVSLAGAVGVLLVVAGLVASLAAFAVRYRRAEGEARQQLRWVGASLALSVVLGVVGATLWGVVPGAFVLPALAMLALPAGIAVAVLRYRLYDLDLVVNRTLVYLVLTVAVIGSYAIVVGLVGSYLSRRADLVVSVAVTGAVAICFQPLRERVQRGINRLMYGERDDPYLAIAGLGRSLASSLEPDSVLPAAVETIGRTLALQYAGVVVGGSGDAEEVATYGTRSDALAFPLLHQGATIGELRLSPRAGEHLRERDRRLVADLTPQVAAAVHAVELARELRSARRRIVMLREEERRRIRRDLHDRLGSPRTRLVVDAPDPLQALEAAVEASTYRIVQEALTNVERHARAGTCTVHLSLEPATVLLRVSDDGCGFSEHRIGVGLQAMHERAVELGGTCEIVSVPGTGTTVSVTLPREAPAEIRS